jgi:hypothetical protein
MARYQVALFPVVVIDFSPRRNVAGAPMIKVRQVLAFPLYLISFIFHLICAFFTWAAMVVAGDDRRISAAPAERRKIVEIIKG